jgi:hypothetical protein
MRKENNRKWEGDTGIRGFHPALFNFIALRVESIKTNVGGGITLGFISIRIHIPCFAIDFGVCSERGSRQLSTKIP